MLKKLASKYWPLVLLIVLIGTILGISRSAENRKAENQNNAQSSSPQAAIAPNDASKSLQNTNKPHHHPDWIDTFTWPDGATVWALLLTLMVIAWQSTETRDAAKATAKGAEAQMNADRAWVLIHGIRNPPTLEQCLHNATVPGIAYEVKICGNTPARIVRERYRCHIVPVIPGTNPPQPQLALVPEFKTENSFWGVDDVVRAPGDRYGVSVSADSGLLTEEQCTDLREEKSILCAYGCIEYRDAFGRDGITSFYHVYKVASGGVTSSPDGTRLTPDSGFRTENRPGYSKTT